MKIWAAIITILSVLLVLMLYIVHLQIQPKVDQYTDDRMAKELIEYQMRDVFGKKWKNGNI